MRYGWSCNVGLACVIWTGAGLMSLGLLGYYHCWAWGLTAVLVEVIEKLG
ncbi:hypothetical protein HanPI659440_Chr11g0434711 [Helianthus annuus]|nr:hypothetical protein HanPI659440_Chr11g0434711 [Helianthus annuus]